MTTTERRQSALDRLRDPPRGPVFWGTFGTLASLEDSLIGNAPVVGDTAVLITEGSRQFVFTDAGWLALSGVNGA